MLERGVATLLPPRRMERTAGVERARYAADQPRRADRRAPDHHPRGARKREHGARVFEGRAIAVDDDRDPDRLDHRADGGPIGAAIVELRARPPVDGRHPRPRLFGPARKFGRVQRRLVPAKPHLDGHGNRHRLDHRGNETLGVIKIAHQRRARQSARYPPRRATHVDVDERGACANDPSRGLRQSPRFAADKLDRMGGQSLALGAHPRLGVALKIGFGRNHLGEHERRPETACDPPHGQIADARHRREQRPSLEPDRSDGDDGGGA